MTRFLIVTWLATVLLTPRAAVCAEAPASLTADVIIYGGTSGGVVAAVQAARMGKTVILLEPGQHLGGMTAGGLSRTDIGNAPDRTRAIGGLTREVYQRIGAAYGMKPGTEFDPPKSTDATRTGVDFAKPPSLSFEPKMAERIFIELVAEVVGKIRFNARLAAVEKSGNRIAGLTAANGLRFRGRVFIDAPTKAISSPRPASPTRSGAKPTRNTAKPSTASKVPRANRRRASSKSPSIPSASPATPPADCCPSSSNPANSAKSATPTLASRATTTASASPIAPTIVASSSRQQTAAVQAVAYPQLRERLLVDGQVLKWQP